jgi:serine/threonine protein phosphatase PrpC
VRFTIFQDSRIGKRKSNQDRIAYSYSRDALLMLVADGMGGHHHGEIAAGIAARSLVESFQREARPALDDPTLFLRHGLTDAHNAILDYAFDRYLPDAPRTTIVACIVQQGSAWWAHAGDSRLYLLRDGAIGAGTRDHSRVQMLLDQGLLDAASAENHPERNRIYSCLGGDSAPQVDHSRRFPLRDGDVIALCSDGVWGPLGDQGMVTGLAHGDVLETAPGLMARAEQLGGPYCDNLSLVVMRWHGGDAPVAESVSTDELARDRFTTRMEGFDAAPHTEGEFSDEDIERAIDEINETIRKLSKQDP